MKPIIVAIALLTWAGTAQAQQVVGTGDSPKEQALLARV